MRNLYINQLLLDEPSPLIHQQLDNLMTKMNEILSSSDDATLKNIFNLERIQIHLRLYSEISKAEPLVGVLCEDLKLDVTLIGKSMMLFKLSISCDLQFREISQGNWANVLDSRKKMLLNSR